MDVIDIAILVTGGLVAGVVNTLAGGGSLLTVPLLVLVGLPGTVANGTNRIGVLVQNIIAARSFSAAGIGELRTTLPILGPMLAGSVVGAAAASQLSDDLFERIFGIVMLLLLIPMLRRPAKLEGDQDRRRPWPPWLRLVVFFAIGLYGGAIQAGVGIALLFALDRAGLDLVRANAIKVVVIGALTAVAVPVFILEGQVAWLPAVALAAGFAAGGSLGARLAIAGGERLIRPVLTCSVIALAGRMVGLY